MERIKHKDSEHEFDRFAAGSWDLLLRTGYLMSGDARDAEDLVQETLLRVARRWTRVRSMDHPAAYARRVLINLVLRDAGRRARQRAELWPQEDGRADAADEAAAQALREVDDLAEFRWALAQLPARQRAVLVLRYWADLPVAEAADILGCSDGTVTSTASRAVARAPGAQCPPERPAARRDPGGGHHRQLLLLRSRPGRLPAGRVPGQLADNVDRHD